MHKAPRAALEKHDQVHHHSSLKPSRRRRCRTARRRRREATTLSRRLQDPSAAPRRNLSTLNGHSQSFGSPAPPSFPPPPCQPGQPARHHLHALLASPPWPARTRAKKKTTEQTCNKNGTTIPTGFSPRRHGRPEKRRRRTAPDRTTPQPPRHRGRSGERRGRMKPKTPTPPSPPSERQQGYTHLN